MTEVSSVKKYFNGIEELLGNTPLVKLKRIFPSMNVFAKLEFFNPSGSIKDRVIFFMIKKALDTRKIAQKNSFIIVPTSGNVGLGACIAAKEFNLNVLCLLPDDVPIEKINLLKAYGAKLILCDADTKSDEIGGYVWLAEELSKKLENSILINQFQDKNNILAHYQNTAPEIWQQLNGKIDYFFAGMGSGGTISGIGKYLKEKNSSIKVIGIDPKGGLYREAFHKKRGSYVDHLIAGVSDNFISPNVEFEYIDEIIEIEDKKAFQKCYELLYYESICAGSSAGLMLEGIAQYFKENNFINLDNKNIVTVLPDSGTRYQNSLLKDEFLNQKEIHIDKKFISQQIPQENVIISILNNYRKIKLI